MLCSLSDSDQNPNVYDENYIFKTAFYTKEFAPFNEQYIMFIHLVLEYLIEKEFIEYLVW